MKKKIYFITTILAATAALSLSSCLKDPRYVNLAQTSPIVNFPLGGLNNFSRDAVTDPGDTIVKQFSIDVASATVPTSPTTVTLAVDNTIITAYNATESAVNYLPMPSGSFVFNSTTVTIPAGQRVAIVSVTFYKNQLDPSQSYMFPIKIVSGSGGAIVSGNFGIHYYHFIGNDFAGLYTWTYTRWNNGTGTGAPLLQDVTPNSAINPVSPTDFQMQTGYNGNMVLYDVQFTKTGPGAYSNWVVTFDPTSVANGWVPNGISVVQQPVFLVLDPAHFHFQLQYVAFNGTADRYLIDDYAKP